MEAGNIMTIGYTGAKHFFFDEIKDDFSAHVGILICKDICIPGEAKLSLKKDQSFIASRSSAPYATDELKLAYNDLPSSGELPPQFEYYLTRKKGENFLTLHYSIKNVTETNLPHQLPLLTGFPHAPWGFKRETLFYKDNTIFGKTEIEWDGEYQDPPLALPESGNFTVPYKLDFLFNDPFDKKVKVVQLSIKDFANASKTLDDFYQGLPPIENATKEVKTSLDKSSNFLKYIFFAFVGGLILNLMPCVLPVISLKLFGLIKHRNYNQKQLLTHNLSYSLGVVSTFMAFALIVAGLKAGGEEIGWGFQLQSPTFILIMMLILFILSLNLFGLFEFTTPGGAKLGHAKAEEGFTADFFSGVLITILSTPCSAPFLGTALTFAFTTNTSTIFIIFFFIALGLSFPFLMTAAFPKSLHILPKPGAWMEKLKYFLGLSLIVTVVWLYDVFVTLVDFEKVSWRLNLLLVLWFFAIFFVKKISNSKSSVLAVFAIPLIFTGFALKQLELRPNDHEKLTQVSKEWTRWSQETLKEYSGKTIFIDFTAEWCLTCKVNKKLVLETEAFKELSKKYELVLMRADWTKRDDHITQFLRSHQAVGVPAYFLVLPNGETKFLGETISISKLESYLR
jgi:thiol:disulfide interchange protein